MSPLKKLKEKNKLSEKKKKSEIKMAAEYTQEQVNIVRRITSKENLYQILGVQENCSDSQLKKAYRKV